MEKNQLQLLWRWLTLAIPIALICGCNRWRLPVEVPIAASPSSTSPDTAKSVPAAASDERPAHEYDWREEKNRSKDYVYVWRNDLLEGMGSDASAVAKLRLLALGGGPEAAAGASIQLGRLERGSRDVDLERIALTTSHTKTTRLAAIETLGSSPNQDARERLLRIARANEQAIPSGGALVGKPIDEDRFLAGVITALDNINGDVKELTKLFAQDSPQMACAALITVHGKRGVAHLPPEAMNCFAHPSIVVRSALLEWICIAHDEDAVDEVLKITRGGDADVLFTAIRTLGFLRNAKSTARLQDMSRDRNPRIRGAALAALIHQDSQSAMTDALNETRWQVKRGVAEFLVEPQSSTQWTFMEEFLLDRTAAAQQTLDRTIMAWSASASERCAVAGLSSELVLVRQNAWNTLKSIHPEQFEFAPTGDEAKRHAQIAEIREKLGVQFVSRETIAAQAVMPLDQLRSSIDQWQKGDKNDRELAELKLLSVGNSLPQALDALSQEELQSLDSKFWTQIAAKADPRFAAASGLKSPDVSERRKAAQKLADQIANAAPPRCLLIWLDDLIAIEEDPLVWRKVLSLTTRAVDDAHDAAAAIALRALPIDTLDVRVTACGILENAPPRAEHVAALEPLLSSESQVEQIAAIKVLGRQTPLTADMLDRLAAFLAEPRGETRIEAALVIAKQSDQRGTELLRTAALTGPEIERRLAVKRLGDTADEAQIPLLIGLLDASPTLRQAAIESLDNLVVEEVIADNEKQLLSSTETASRWKAWHSTRKLR